jgi:hypothetical protein
MPPLLTATLNEAARIVESRSKAWPSQSTLADADRLVHLTDRHLHAELLLADSEEAEDVDGG